MQGSSCKNETPIRLAPQEDIEDRPRRAVPRSSVPLAARSLLAKPKQSATSCPRSPPSSSGHGQTVAVPLRGRFPPASAGRRSRQNTGRQKEAGITVRNCRLPAASADPPCYTSPRAACHLGARLWRRVQGAEQEPWGAGYPGASGARGLPTLRARFLFLCYFPGFPRTASCLASIVRN